MKVIALVMFLLLFFSSLRVTAAIETVEVEFEREYGSQDVREISKGRIYYQAPDNIKVRLTSPIEQYITIEGQNVLIYYPREKKAFKIVAKNPVALPFFQAFLGMTRQDYGMTNFGYSLSSHEKKGETLITYWAPPKPLSRLLGRFKLVYVSQKLVYAELEDPEGRIVCQSSYNNHICYDSTYFPLQISSKRRLGENFVFENIVYYNPRFNEEFPREVVYFKIPPDVEIEEIRW